MKDSFIIYKSYYEPIKGLSDKQLGRLFRALFCYQIEGSTQVDADIQMAFAFFKNQMDIDQSKYQKVVDRNKLNGSKGGRPTKGEKPKNPVGLEKPKKPDNDNEYEYDNDNNISPNGDCESNESDSPAQHQTRINYKKILELYHSTCVSFTRIEKLTESRKKKLSTRISEFKKTYPDADYLAVFYRIFLKIEDSSFLKGDNKNNWKCSFDWIFENDKNWIKIIEGNYDNKNKPNNSTNGINAEFFESIAEGIARAEYSKSGG